MTSKYDKRPWYFPNSHFETIIPSLFFKVDGVDYQRDRLELEDGDFLDLDWLKDGNDRLIIISHGLEGSTQRHYVKRPAKFFHGRGWDILAWNNRSCSGEMNRLPRFYHHGATDDIAAVIDQGLSKGYKEVVLIGSSMGAGMQQKYLGEREVDKRIIGAISFSVPCNVLDSAIEVGKKGNRFYERKFISRLKEKVFEKAELMDLPVDLDEIRQVQNFSELDTAFTLKIHPEYEDVDDFYQKIASDQYLPNIRIPLLIVNALNDPMLGTKCYPIEIAESMDNIYLEMPRYGGHIGFTIDPQRSYMEVAAERFINEILS